MTFPRIVKPDSPEPDTLISHDDVRRRLEKLLARNPVAVMILAEIGDEVHNDCVPDSGVLRLGLIRATFETFEGRGE
jgi:hypothetical protein